jgi:hypothetical protein
MRTILLFSLLALGCVHAVPVAAPTTPQNRAIAIVTLTDKDAKCADLRRPFDVEDSAICQTGGALLWVSVSAGRFEIKQLVAPPAPKPDPPKVIEGTYTSPPSPADAKASATPTTKAPKKP